MCACAHTMGGGFKNITFYFLQILLRPVLYIITLNLTNSETFGCFKITFFVQFTFLVN